MEKLFVYGTLKKKSVQGRIVGRTPRSRPAAIRGWRPTKVRVEGKTYPAAIPADKKRRVRGVLLFVTKRELKKIDAYEGESYKRVGAVLSGGEKAWVYQKN